MRKHWYIFFVMFVICKLIGDTPVGSPAPAGMSGPYLSHLPLVCLLQDSTRPPEAEEGSVCNRLDYKLDGEYVRHHPTPTS